MENNILLESMNQFLDDLSSNKPTPGGGSVAAVVGALGEGLVLMVSNFTTGKEKYKDVQNLVNEAIELGNNYLDKFKEFTLEDIKVYQKVRSAYKLPNETDEEKTIRKHEINKKVHEALLTPLLVLEYCEKAMDLLEKIYEKFNMNLISDFGVACKLFEASAYSAYLNKIINENSLTKDYKEQNNINYGAKAYDLCENKIKKISDKIYKDIVEMLNK